MKIKGLKTAAERTQHLIKTAASDYAEQLIYDPKAEEVAALTMHGDEWQKIPEYMETFITREPLTPEDICRIFEDITGEHLESDELDAEIEAQRRAVDEAMNEFAE